MKPGAIRENRAPTARRRRAAYGGSQRRNAALQDVRRRVRGRGARQRATHGVVPLENSIGGTIHRNYDLLVEHELPITGEVELDVVHCLQALPGTRLGRREDRVLAPAGAGAVREVSERAAASPSKPCTTRPAAPSWWPSRSWPAPRRWRRAGRPRCSASRCCRKRCRTTSSTSRASRSSAARRRRTPTRPRSCSRCRARPARSSRR